MRTAEVSSATGYSVQRVRDLERLGAIPPAERAANGYRRFGPVHVHALRAYRGLAAAVGPVEARRVLTAVHALPVEAAAAEATALHARLDRDRREVLGAQEALRSIRGEPGSAGGAGRESDAMTVAELAEALGVRPSALRFWEAEGLLAPARVTSSRARRYRPADAARARIVAALRGGGYGLPAIRAVLGTLDGAAGPSSGAEAAGGTVEQVLAHRLDRIAAASVALLRAGADLAAVVDGAHSGRRAEPRNPAAAPQPASPPKPD
ncbi:MerR family transcriptional regulator [Nocardiopsis coralliicola]